MSDIQQVKEILNSFGNLVEDVELKKAIQTVLTELDRLEKENKQNNRIIQLMAEHMIDKGINNIDTKNITATMYSNLIRQTKNYFESKVKEKE